MTGRRLLAMASPGLALVLVTLVWNAWDYRAELREGLRHI